MSSTPQAQLVPILAMALMCLSAFAVVIALGGKLLNKGSHKEAAHEFLGKKKPVETAQETEASAAAEEDPNVWQGLNLVDFYAESADDDE